MSEELVAVKIFSNETDATMAQQLLREAGVRSFILKDDAGGMEPHLQRTGGVRLIVEQAEAERANEVLQRLDDSA